MPEHESREAFGTLGLAYQSLCVNQLDKAVEMFQRQLAVARGHGWNIEGQCPAEWNVAIIFHATGRDDMAIEYFEECLTKANQSDDAAMSVHSMEELEGSADTYLCLQMPEQACEIYRTRTGV